MSTPTFVSVGAVQSGTGSLTVAWGAGHQADDIGLLVIETGGEGTTLTPSGWSHVTGSPLADIADATGSKLHVLWKRATSSAEADVVTGDSGDHQIARLTVYRGCETSGNPWDVTTTDTKTTASTSVSAPSVTTTVDDTLVVACISRAADQTGSHFNSFTNGNLSSVTKRIDSGTAAGHGGGICVVDGGKASAGSTGATTTTMDISDTNAYLVLALKGPGVGAMSATLAGSSALDSTLAGAGALGGTCSGAASSNFTLTGDGALAASFSGDETLGAALDGAGTLAGTFAGSSSWTALLVGSGALECSLGGTSVFTAQRQLDLSLTVDDINAIAEAVWVHPKALTLAKFLALK